MAAVQTATGFTVSPIEPAGLLVVDSPQLAVEGEGKRRLAGAELAGVSHLAAVSLQKLCFVDSSNKRLVRSFNTITYFDVKSDELKELPRPEFIGAYESYRLACLKGSVGLYGGSCLYNCELDIWIMEQDGWTRVMKINCYNPVFIDEFLRNIVLLGCTRNGEIIFQARIMGLERLLMYDPKQNKFLNPIGISGDFKLDVIPVFSESFYFPST
ncbi:hypothetical protein BC332_06477 [Capsicum chinense]|nr:hypothetical protein BC332_06477 [Capsicum chinense]